MAFEQKSLDDYIDVAQRIADFRETYPDGTLQAAEPWRIVQAEGWEKNGDHVMQSFIVYVAAAYRQPHDPRPGIGVAWEVFPGRTPYTRGSELMNAETSAWGRAIIAVGASDSKRGIASREEVRNRQAERDDGLPVNRDGSLSRSRTTDEEKAAAGVMTSAQLAEHSALQAKRAEQRPAERLAAVPADDAWYGGAGTRIVDLGVDENTPGTITRGQQAQYHARFAALGIKDRDERLLVTSGLLGAISTFASSSDLSHNQAAALLERLRAAGEGDSVAQLAVEEARRRPVA